MSSRLPKRLPRHVWADWDPTAPANIAWAFYRTKAEQRSNRPDLRPIRLEVDQSISWLLLAGGGAR